jgi:hypothetical protein
MGFWPLGDESISNTVGKERDTGEYFRFFDAWLV